MKVEISSGTKLRSFVVYILIFLYTTSVLSVFLTHTTHELHHLITHTMHLHHHHPHPPQSATNDPIINHGHEHGELIDTALQNINKDDINSEAHNLLMIYLFEHLKVLSQAGSMRIPDDYVNWIQYNLTLITKYTPVPQSPPPRCFSA